MWIEGSGRVGFEKRHWRAIDTHRDKLKQASALEHDFQALYALLQGVHTGDAEAMRTLARRWVALELRLAGLRQAAVPGGE